MEQSHPNLVHVDMRKWPDRRHWQFHAHRLGDDEHGTWLHVPSDTIVQRGDEPPRSVGVGFIGLVPPDEWWIAEFYARHPWHSVYVNIGTPPVWDEDRVTQVDLDLDVARKLDGSVVTLDEDEFAEHQVRYSYPTNLIDGARAATSAATEMVERRIEPFASAADRWMARVDRSTLS